MEKHPRKPTASLGLTLSLMGLFLINAALFSGKGFELLGLDQWPTAVISSFVAMGVLLSLAGLILSIRSFKSRQ